MTLYQTVNSKFAVLQYIVFICFVNFQFAYSEEFNEIQTKDWLTSKNINSIVQDSNGFIWVSTSNEVARYDGYSFKVLKGSKFDALYQEDISIFNITTDKVGNVWICSDRGLFQYNICDDRLQNIYASSIIGRVFSCITDDNGNIWIASSKGLFFCSGTSKRINLLFSRKISSDDFKKASFAWDKSGSLLISTKKGIYKVSAIQSIKSNFDKSRNKQLFIHLIKKTTTKCNIYTDKFYNTWIWNNSELTLFNSDDKVLSSPLVSYKLQNITTVYDLKSNDVWIGVRGRGNFQIKRNKTGLLFPSNNLLLEEKQIDDMKNTTNCYFEDKDENLWIGTKDGLFIRYHTKPKLYTQYRSKLDDPNSLSHNTVSGIYTTENGNVYVATANGLNKLITVNGRLGFERFHNLKNNKFETLCEDNNGVLWIGTKTKLCFFDPTTSKFINKKEIESDLANLKIKFARSIVKDKRGNIFIGFASGGVIVFDNNLKKISRLNIQINGKLINDCYALSLDKDNSLWVGLKTQGILKVEYSMSKPSKINKLKLVKFQTENSTKNTSIRSIHCDPVNNIWVGTTDGLFKLNRDLNQFEKIKLDLQQKWQYVSAILSDDVGNVWVSFLNGICKISISDNKFKFIEFLDGGYSRENFVFGSTKDKDGNLWLGGVDGLTKLDPVDVKLTENQTVSVITGFKIFNNDYVSEKELNKTEVFKLRNSDNLFSISFSSLNYSSANKIKYSYILDGFDKDWTIVDASRRFATYSNLDRGIYAFRLKCTDENGIWSNNERIIKIQVLASPWLSWWMIIVYLILITALVLAVLKLLFRWNKLRFEDKLSRERLDFYTNLIYSFKTPLTLLQSPLKKLNENFDVLTTNEKKEYINLMQRNSIRLTQIIYQLMEFRKIDEGDVKLNLIKTDIVSFLKRIFDSFNELAINRSIDFRFSSNVETLELAFDAEKIENAVFQLITNAFQFTPSNKSIDLVCEFVADENKFWVKIKDTGIGIKPENIQHVFQRFWSYKIKDDNNFKSGGMGLSLAKDFIELHQGKISVRSELEVGSEFSFYLLSEHDFFKNEPVKVFKGKTEFEDYAVNYIDVLQDVDPVTYINKKLPIVFFIDDDISMRKYIKKSLADITNVISFANTDEMLLQLEQRLPDIIISETIINKTTAGIELCTQLKLDVRYKHIPFVFLSSLSAENDIVAGYAAGADAYYPKPFDEAFFHSRIQQTLNFNTNLKEKIKREILINPKEIRVQSLDDRFLQKAIQVMEKNIAIETFNVDTFAKAMNLSTSMFYRKLKKLTDKSPVEFIIDFRMNRALQLLETNAFSISEIAEKVGYFDYRYFSTTFKKHFGVSPTTYNKDKI